MADLPKEPVTRQEEYLSRLAGENTTLPKEPVTREEMYLEGAIARVEAVEEEVEEMKNNPDVADIVATYADLTAYDKTKLTDKDVIRVLADETHDGDSTYYRYDKSTNVFTYIGESKQYTDFVGTDGQTAGTSGLVPAPATTDADRFLKSDGTWAEAGGSSVNIVQTAGTSTTDVMSQNAVTSMVFADPSTQETVKIGNGARTGSVKNVAIGYSAYGGSGSIAYAVAVGGQSYAPNPGAVALGGTCNAQSDGSVAIGRNATVYSGVPYGLAIGYASKANREHNYSVALGAYASTTRAGEVNIGTGNNNHGYDNTDYRVLGGVHDGQSNHDAATVAQGNTLSTSAPTASTEGVLGQLWTDTTNMHTYQCTAISGGVYTWTQRW